MAKKVRKDGERKEERKVVFEAPEFDEREYLTEQLRNVRTSLFFILLAIPSGAAWAFTAILTDNNVLGLLASVAIYIVGVQVLKFVIGNDILAGEKKVIAMTFLVFIFTSLAFAVVLSNPPTNDVTPPSVTDVAVLVDEGGDGGWDLIMRHKSLLPLNKSNQDRFKESKDQRLFTVDPGDHATRGDNVSILVRAADASGLERVEISHGYQDISSAPVPMERVSEERWEELGMGGDFFLWGEHYYEFVLTNVAPGNLYFRITIEDSGGHTRVFETELPAESILVYS